MRFVNVKQLARNLSGELDNLPFVVTKYGKPYAIVKGTDNSSVVVERGTEEVSTEDAPICEKCHSRPAEYKFWEEGEERSLCLKCIELGVPPKMLPGFLQKCEKI